MGECKLFRMSEGAVGTLDVDTEAFGRRAPRIILREAVLMYQANRRAGTHDTQDRGDVTANIKKPWKQKHTGRARSGRKNSPIWRGGSVAHGPHPRDYSYKMPRKALRAATRAALAAKFRDGEVAFMDAIELEEPSTKKMAAAFAALGVRGSFLLVVEDHAPTTWKSVRNLQGASMLTAADVNAYEVLKNRTLVLTPRAFELLQERLGPAGPKGEEE